MTPRAYFSWSQYNLFGRSPESYRQRYIYGDEGFKSKEMLFGKQMAEIRENGEEDKFILSKFSQYPRREYEITATVKIDGKKVVLLGKLDGVNLRKHIIGEDKTGKFLNIGSVSRLEQLTWYAYLYYLKFKKIPKLEVNWIETKEENGKILATGNVKTFQTQRTIADFLRLHAKINARWRGVLKLCAKELNEIF